MSAKHQGRGQRATVGLMLAGLLLTACGSDPDAAADDSPAQEGDGAAAEASGDVTMWVYPLIGDEGEHRAFWDERIEDFSSQFGDVNVEVTIQPWANRDEQLSTAIAGGVGPDVVYLLPDQIPQYAEAGSIVPVDELVDDGFWADYYDNALESVTYEGARYTAPMIQTVNAIIWNREVMEDAGIDEYPNTWDGLLEIAPQLQDAGYYLSEFNVSHLMETLNMSWYPILWSAGGEVFTDDGSSVAFNEEPGVEALEFLRELVENDYMPEESLTQQPSSHPFGDHLGTGGAAMSFAMANNLVHNFSEAWGEENVVVGAPLEHERRIGYGTVGGFAVTSNAEDHDAVAAWLTHMTSEETMESLAASAGFLAPKETIQGLYDDDPILGEFEEYLADMTVGPVHPQAREVMGVLGPELQAALLGQKSAQQALDDAAASAEPLIGR
jgi:multiple sugar transport system substrate-binding protein